MKKRFFFIICLFLTIILTSCDLLGGSLQDYITEYTQNAAIERYAFNTVYPRDATDTACMNSEGNIQIFLRNPMAYSIEFEYAFSNPQVQLFYDLNYADFSNIRYLSISSDNTIYSMNFPVAFRQAIDECAIMTDKGPVKDISGTLFAYEQYTHRPFGFYEIKLHADTIPESISNYMIQLDQDPTGEKAQQAKYIVCFMVARSPRNNDFKTIKINGDTWNIAYDYHRDMVPGGIQLTPASGNKGTLIVNPRSPDEPDDRPLIPAVYPIEVGADTFTRDTTGDYDTFYYISGEPRSDVEKIYTITISDAAGLSTTSTVSNKAEKLQPPTLPAFVPGQTLTAGINGKYQFVIEPQKQTTSGNDVTGSTDIEYKIEILSNDYEIIDSGEWTTLPVKNGSYTLELEPKEYGENYRITARSKGTGYLQSEPAETIDFRVIRGNHFFVSSSEGYDGEGYTGTLTKPYRTFSKALEAIMEYQEELTKFPDVPVNSYYIDVPQNYMASDADFTGSYLINNDSTSFAGKLTIQGVDENGNPLNGKSKRTIDGGTWGSFISWTGNNQTLTIRDLTLQKFSNSSSGGCIRIFMTQKQNSIVTIERCDITNNTTDSQGGGIWIQGGGGTNTRVTVKDCNITYNTANEGAGVHITYGGPNPSDELYVIDGNTTISNNTAGRDGGGLFICNKVEIASPNVTISSNTSGQGGRGAGVFFGGGSLSLKGGTITGNKVKGDSEIPSNLYIVSGMRLSVTGDLSGSKIGITTATAPTDDTSVEFASGSGIKDGVFTSDNGDYIIAINGSTASLSKPSRISGQITIPNIYGVTASYQVDYNDNYYTVTPFIEGTEGAEPPVTKMIVYAGSVEMPKTFEGNKLWEETEYHEAVKIYDLAKTFADSHDMTIYVYIEFKYYNSTYSCMMCPELAY